MKNLSIHNELYSTIQEYCHLNSISDIEKFLLQCLKQGFDIKKYGLLGGSEPEKQIEIIEKEVIKYVDREIIKEVSVIQDKDCSELVEKETLDLRDKMSKLSNTLQTLRSELQAKEDELSAIKTKSISQSATFLRTTNLKDQL